MNFVRYNGQVAVIAKSGQELVVDQPGSELDDHMGLWFGEINEVGHPIIYTIPAHYVEAAESITPEYRH